MTSSPRLLPAAALVCALVAAGCAPSVEVSVQVLTDLAPASEFDRITLDRGGVEVVGRSVAASERFDRPYVLAELTDVSPGSNLRLTVSLRRGGAAVLTRSLETRVDASRVLLFVLSSACRGVTCPPPGEPSATECEDGVCVEASCQGNACSPDAGRLDAHDADPRLDAPAPGDAGVPDPEDTAVSPDAASDASFDAGGWVDATDVMDAGSDAATPSDAFSADAPGTCTGRPAGFVCRAARGPCDVAEVCDGTAAVCPRDGLAAAGTMCRDRARGRPCDAVETCSGMSAACPGDRDEPNGTRCDQYCGSETCMDGVCTGGVSCAPMTHTCCEDVCTPTLAC
jgi:hypothetical protein